MNEHDLAFEHWSAGRALEAGRCLYESLPDDERPTWAARVLDVCCSLLENIPRAVEDVRVISSTPERWSEAHDAFHAVRAVVLDEVHGPPHNLRHCVLLLAENVAKVTYNATGRPAPFDHNAGWRIAACARDAVLAVGTQHFAAAVWNALRWQPDRAQ